MIKRNYALILEKYLLSNRKFSLSVSIALFTALMLIVFYCISYSAYKNQQFSNLKLFSEKIDDSLSRIFNGTSQLMLYVGQQIAENNVQDLNVIFSLIKNIPPDKYKNHAFSWTLFDWVDNHNLQTVNQVNGIHSHPKDMSDREYVRDCRKYPWTLQFAKPAVGFPSKMLVIPAAMGITNSNREFLGLLVVGFNIDKLVHELVRGNQDSQLNFLILDKQSTVILSNNRLSQAPRVSGPSTVIHNKLTEDFKYKNFYKSVSIKMNGFPYTIMTGINRQDYITAYIQLVTPFTILLLSIGCFFIMIVEWIRKKMLGTEKRSNTATSEFNMQMNQRLQINIDRILFHSDLLVRSLTSKVIELNGQNQRKYVEKIHNYALAAKNIANDRIEETMIEIHSIIKSSLESFSMIALQKNIFIGTELYPLPACIKGNFLHIKQGFLHLLSFIINHTRLGGSIIISTALDNNRSVVNLLYDSFDLTETDIIRIGKYNEDSAVDDLESAMNLIQLNHGSFGMLDVNEKRLVTIRFNSFPDYKPINQTSQLQDALEISE